jgi:hypothetical protein
MEPERQKRVVQVHRPEHEGKAGEVATGFAISPSRVLTCAHVLAGKAPVRVRFIDVDRARWLDASIEWNGLADTPGRNVDVAILGIQPASPPVVLDPRTAPRLDAAEPVDMTNWISRGIPQAANTVNVDGGEVSHAVDFSGFLYAPTGGIFGVFVTDPPADAEDWAGASGTPVLAGDRLLGVIIKWLSGWKGDKLTAQWLAPLLDQPAFLKALDLSSEQHRLSEWAEKTAALLSGSAAPGLLGLLAAELRPADVNAAAVVKAMNDLGRPDFVSLGNVVGEALVGDGTESRHPESKRLAPIMEGIVEAGLAARLGAHVLVRLILRGHGGAGGGLVQLQCVYPVLAECFCAGIDDRPIALDDIPPAKKKDTVDPWKDLREHGHDQWPTLCIPMEPKCGFEKDSMDRPRAILSHLVRQFRIPGHLSEAEQFRRVNQRVLGHAEPGFGHGGRWFYLFSSISSLPTAGTLV